MNPRLRRGTTSPASIRWTFLVKASEATADTGFMARLMALCCLPRTNPSNQHQYKRVNGPFTLYMNATSDNKLPFGNIPRLLLAWVSTEAVRTQNRELILGASLSEFMRTLGVLSSDCGGASGIRTRLQNQMRRLFHCTVSLVYEDENGNASMTALIADRMEFWWTPKRPDDRSLWKSKIHLSETFFNEIINHPVPLDMNTLQAMKRSSLGLDLYLWLAYRTFTLRAPLRLSWRQVYRQFGAHPVKAVDNHTVDNFRTDCLRELKKIKVAWPDLNYAAAKGVLVLLPSKPAVPPHVAVSARGVVLKSPLLVQNRSLAVPGDPGEASFLGYPRRIASRAPESLFHKTPVISGSFPG